ncbi:MAG: thioesterase family protein [Sneathiellaceae bacterium]
MSGDSPTADLSDPAVYQHWEALSLRFSDQDSQGHINNVAYAAYIEAGRVAFCHDIMRGDPAAGVADFVLAHLAIDYRAEMHYPGMLQIGSCVHRIGTKSVRLGHGIFLNGRLHATAESVLVFIDTNSRGSIVVPPGMRSALERLQPLPPPDGARPA